MKAVWTDISWTDVTLSFAVKYHVVRARLPAISRRHPRTAAKFSFHYQLHCVLLNKHSHSHIAATSRLTQTLSIMDRESELLLLEMQLEDLNQLVAGNDAMNCNGDRSDYDVSLELLRQDLIDRITAHKDRALCSSIACALNRDHPALEHQREMENSALQDREMALSLDQDPTTARTAGQDPHNQQEHLLDDETLVKLAMRYNSEEAGMSILGFDNDDASDTSPAAATRRALKQAAITRQCTACQDNFKICDIARAPCSHEYCGECLGAIFTGAIGDEAYYPPRCCRQTIPLEKVRMFLPADIAQDFQAKVPELETKDRTYCHVPNCSAWISPDHIVNGTGTCPSCGAETCVTCKAETHQGDCPADEGTQQLLEVARGQRWQRCYQCRRVIELNTGCYHITSVFSSRWLMIHNR